MNFEHFVRDQLGETLLWHATNRHDFICILSEGAVRPRNRTDARWAPKGHACQVLGGFSVFDWAKLPADNSANDQLLKAEQFLSRSDPTVLIGISRSGRVVGYPENRDLTNDSQIHGPIPDIESCMIGPRAITEFRRFCLLWKNPTRVFFSSDFRAPMVPDFFTMALSQAQRI